MASEVTQISVLYTIALVALFKRLQIFLCIVRL